MTTAAAVLGMVAGLALLVGGGELLVRGASRLAAALRISPLVIGLTVVAFGTSAPELAVSVDAALRGNPDIAVGNVVGSNIFNTLFILGACALILPLVVSVQLVRREVPVMIGVSILLVVLGVDGRIGSLDGVVLTAGIFIYTSWSVMSGRAEGQALAPVAGGLPSHARWPTLTAMAAVPAALLLAWYGVITPLPAGVLVAGATCIAVTSRGDAGRMAGLVSQAGVIVAGLGLLMLGAQFLVDAATGIARALGVSDLVIGLTIVAAGTSLPEVATSITATIRGERDIAIGNVVGSNIFNILGILGVASLVAPGGLPVAASLVRFDLPVMLGAAVACLPIFFTGLRVERWEGAVFLGSYAAYTALLVLGAMRAEAAATLARALLLVVPLVVIVLGWSLVQALRTRERGD